MTNVCAFGGGHGLYASLRALRQIPGLSITAIVTVGDDGGSSGRLRAERGVLPPGDLRQALAALAGEDPFAEETARLFQHRFAGTGTLAGHAVGNLVLSGLMELLGDPVAALDHAGFLLRACGRVLPMSPVPVSIEADARDEDGKLVTIRGQHEVAVTGEHVEVVRLLPPEVSRILYLDCDTMVRRPIEELFDLDMQGFPVAAVADPYHDGIKLGRDIRSKESPFDSAAPYFNSGVLLIDRAGFAAADLPGKVKQFAQTGVLEKLYFDQDILNLVFAENWLELPWRFNLMLPRKAHEGLGPAIIHYTGHRRPWWPYSGVAFSRTYRHVMTNDVFNRQLRERVGRMAGRLIGRKG